VSDTATKPKLGTCDGDKTPHLQEETCVNWKPIKRLFGGFWSGLGNAIGEALLGGNR
jgi:hypothetical protein